MYEANKNELEILEFWKKNQIFEKSVAERSENNPYVFYDGPPFATGLPHYGHIMAGTKKDVVPRYQTMKGKRVERVWGWDCHGLPIENLIEKELGLSGPKEIRDYGVGKFNEACRAKVLEYADEWKQIIPRMGRWVDMEHPYKTMDVSFMESVWWVFSELWKKGLIYEGKKVMQICPRCATPLSNFEVSQGYKDIKDLSVIARFTITDEVFLAAYCGGQPTSFVAWTTTPWSIPTTMGLAVGKEYEYVVVAIAGEDQIICAKKRYDYVTEHLEPGSHRIVRELSGEDIVGISYIHPFQEAYAAHEAVRTNDNKYKTYATDYVSVEDGTGIVTINGAFGEIDYGAATQFGLPVVVNVRMDGTYDESMGDLAGRPVKPKHDPTEMDVEMVKRLKQKGALLRKEKYLHSYPHCWRCDTPLLNYATSSWFVKVTELKDQLIANNQKITWIPEHIKEGRFGKWLEGVKDWSISRNRFWGTPLPVWKCGADNCGHIEVIGSIAEWSKIAKNFYEKEHTVDLHKDKIDHIELYCPKCSDGFMTRVPEVLDTWFDSGCVPYGQVHYPFENKEKFEKEFPADYIAESQDQTRGWFYTLHVLATALTSGKNPSIDLGESTSAFKTVSVNGIILAEDGQKMSKRLQNYPDPMDVVHKYGADALRFYLLSSPVMHGESLNFSEAGVREVFSKVVNTLWNVVEFYQLFANEQLAMNNEQSDNVLDKWILAKLQVLIQEVTEQMDNNRIAEAVRPIVEFVTELSQWYVRRSRDRFKGEDEKDRQAALATLHEVLLTLSKVLAPFTPFVAEKVYLALGGEKESVHLEEWPEVSEKMIDAKVLENMEKARKIVEIGLALRAEAGIKVRQPLSALHYPGHLADEYLSIIASEVNVHAVGSGILPASKEYLRKENQGFEVGLSIEITPELQKLGLVREIVRTINQMRKEQKLTIQDQVVIAYSTEDAVLKQVFEESRYVDGIKRQVLAKEIQSGGEKEVEIDGRKLRLAIVKH